MERKLQERMVGAGVLVLVLVIVVPLILDGGQERGPDPQAIPGQRADELRVRTFDLRATEEGRAPVVGAQPVAQAPVPPPPASVEAAGAATAAAPAAGEAGGEDAMPKAAPEPVATQESPPAAVASAVQPPPTPDVAPPPRAEPPPPAPRPVATGGGWLVQLGTFGQRDNAERLAAELGAKGFAAVLSTTSVDGRTLYRVRVGPAGSREAAATLAGRLSAAGYKGNVVPQ